MTNEELVLEFQNGSIDVLEHIVKKNEKMIRKLVSKFYTDKTNAIDEEDLFQEGMLGMIKACKKYDFANPNRTKFINYAVNWIYKSIYKFIQSQQTNDEASLNLKDGMGNEVGDSIVEDENYIMGAEQCIYYQQVREELGEAMYSELTLKEMNIIKLHYGWDSSCTSMAELSDIYSMPKRDIQKINRKSLHKLRDSSWGRRERKNRW